MGMSQNKDPETLYDFLKDEKKQFRDPYFETFLHVVYLTNHTAPNIAHLDAFGSTGWRHIQKPVV